MGQLREYLEDYVALMQQAVDEEEEKEDELEGSDAESEEGSLSPAFLAAAGQEVELPVRGEIPTWAVGNVRDVRGSIALSHDQYVGLVQLNDVLVEAILVMGGARSLMDL